MRALRDYDGAEFVRDKEGAARAGMSINTFRKLSDEFKCTYHVGRIRLTRWSDFCKGLEAYKA